MSWLGNVARWPVINWVIETIRLGRLVSVYNYLERGQLSRSDIQTLISIAQRSLALTEFDMPAPSKPDSDYTASSQGNDDGNKFSGSYLH